MHWIGSGSAVSRLWTQPSLTVTGLDAPRVQGASNTLAATSRAMISMRIAPGDSSSSAFAALSRHLEQHAPWGAEVTVTFNDGGEAIALDASGSAYDVARRAFTEAWDGTEPVDIGVGGLHPLHRRVPRGLPRGEVLVTGVEDPDTRAHGADEGLHLAEFARVCLAETLLLHHLAPTPS